MALKKIFGSIILPLCWTVLIQVLLCLPGSSLPGMSTFKIPHFDKYVPIVLFGVFASLWCYFFYCKGFSTEKLRKFFLGVFFAAAVNGILLEFIQYFFIPDRSFDVWDIVANLAGAGIAAAISYIKLLKISGQ